MNRIRWKNPEKGQGFSVDITYNLDDIDAGWGQIYHRTTATMTSLTMPTGATVDYTFITSILPTVRLSKYVKDIDVDPIGGWAFTTSYGYIFSGENVSSAGELRADGSRHDVDFLPDTSDNPFLRETQTWTYSAQIN